MFVPNVDDLLAWEHLNERGDHRGYQRFIQARVANVGFVVSGSAEMPGWSWGELVQVATSQASKIRTHVAADDET